MNNKKLKDISYKLYDLEKKLHETELSEEEKQKYMQKMERLTCNLSFLDMIKIDNFLQEKVKNI